MVNKMQKLCRRDFLWKSLQKMEMVEEETRRRRKTGADDDQREVGNLEIHLHKIKIKY